MWFSRECCGGPVLAMFAMCVGIGLMLVLFSAYVPALVFFAAGVSTQALCLLMGRSRCHRRLGSRQSMG